MPKAKVLHFPGLRAPDPRREAKIIPYNNPKIQSDTVAVCLVVLFVMDATPELFPEEILQDLS